MNVTLSDTITLSVQLFALFNVAALAAVSLVWLERRFLGRLQGRPGPNRVGPLGLLQPIADAIKLMSKEDVAPGSSQRLLFYAAPILVFVPAFVVWLTFPLARDVVVRNMDMGLFFFVAISVLSIVGLVLAGWSSNSKYAILGGFRAAAQLVSYEIPIITMILIIGMLSDSLDFVKVVDAQATIPFIAVVPLAFVIFLIAGLAEVGRTPFDIYFAESEVVGGPFVEYSGAHWAIFFLAEYVNTFVIGILGALLFLGGWRWPFGADLPQVASVALLMGKAYFIVLIIFWIRGTYPRMRIDQLMAMAWKWLIPLSFVLFLAAAFQLKFEWPWWVLTILSLVILVVPVIVQSRKQRNPALELAARYAANAIVVQAKPRPAPAVEDAPVVTPAAEGTSV
ncbi:MAG: NADH-quinone oxidoreductase subunit NuoH [Chloroflexi bacterium]|nr:NADH-quinone oxidoreductase subunit NuoH [Chloroflexota bacterium]MDA1172933.1 NADH-quinone oxidoreductase subunit NuoH [Chloroflexota bacterium]